MLNGMQQSTSNEHAFIHLVSCDWLKREGILNLKGQKLFWKAKGCTFVYFMVFVNVTR